MTVDSGGFQVQDQEVKRRKSKSPRSKWKVRLTTGVASNFRLRDYRLSNQKKKRKKKKKEVREEGSSTLLVHLPPGGGFSANSSTDRLLEGGRKRRERIRVQ